MNGGERMAMRRRSLAQARRIALAAQGFATPRPTGRVDVRHFRRAANAMQVVQVDSVNVMQRSHRMPFFSRLGAYDVDRLDAWLWDSREWIEVWCHVASLIPMEQWPLVGWRETKPSEHVQELFEAEPAYVAEVAAHVRENGPTGISDLPDPGERTGPWWGVPKGRLALEWLFSQGTLQIAGRTSQFMTRYDLTERIVPDEIRAADDVSPDDAMRQHLLLAAMAHGIGTVKDLADVHRLPIIPSRRILAELVDDGQLIPVSVEGWAEPAFEHPAAKLPRSIGARALLTPFDPVVWFRDRAEQLFDFRYRIEIYVPEPKRTYGYYVLPFLLDHDLVGRVDLKHDRKRNVLMVPGAYAEPTVDGSHVDRTRIARELADELELLATWIGARSIELGTRGDLVQPLSRVLG